MSKAIDLNNFRVVWTGNPDVERNYINDILHAIASRLSTIEKATGISDAPIDGNLYGRMNGGWIVVPSSSGSTSPLTTKGDLYTYTNANARLPVGTNGQILSADSAQATGLRWKTLPTITLSLSLFSGAASTLYGSGTKLVLGSVYFDPSNPAHGLSPSSVATLYMLLETTSGSALAAGELFQKSGTGSPQIIAATSTTTSTTATLVSANVSSAFTNTSPSGIFVARCWTGVPNGLNQATCTGAWIEIIP